MESVSDDEKKTSATSDAVGKAIEIGLPSEDASQSDSPPELAEYVPDDERKTSAASDAVATMGRQ